MGGRRGTRTLDPFLVRAERGTNECPITSQYVAPARGSANVSTRRDTSTAHKLRTHQAWSAALNGSVIGWVGASTR